jgi:glycosyltransferase involved in cell wall biosynthesis
VNKPKPKPKLKRKAAVNRKPAPIGLLHGYLLDGSGSNLWTQAVVRALCRAGNDVHLLCQEPRPEHFDFIARAIRYDGHARPTVLFDRDVPYQGACTLHRPDLGGILPVYVEDRYEEHQRVIPMIKLDDEVIEDYVARNTVVLDRVVSEHRLTALHANHAVLMPVVARRVARDRTIPFTIMPHGSAIEYAVKRDARFHRMASQALRRAGRVFVIGPEIRGRLRSVFPRVPGLEEKLVDLPLGVDARRFAPVEPAERRDSIGRLAESLREPPRPAAHEGPDADCAAKLGGIDWAAGKNILYVGRLIAAKGPQAIVAAMPSILQHEPEARLILVGHGPLRRPLERLIEALQTGDRDRLRDALKQRDGGVAGDEDPLLYARRYVEHLEAKGELTRYLKAAREGTIEQRVVFTGYLTHRHLRYLFPSCDVAVFPSLVPEAGPLVFLEAVASGVFPLGTDFAGMAANIDALSREVPPAVSSVMKLRRDPEHLAADIASHVVGALALGPAHAERLRRSVIRRHDWSIVAGTLLKTLNRLRSGATSARKRAS